MIPYQRRLKKKGNYRVFGAQWDLRWRISARMMLAEKHREWHLVTISYPLFTELMRHAAGRVRPENVRLFVGICGHVCDCNMAAEIQNHSGFQEFFTKTIWLSFKRMTDVDADSQGARHWPAVWSARKPSDKTLHRFWQDPPSSCSFLDQNPVGVSSGSDLQ